MMKNNVIDLQAYKKNKESKEAKENEEFDVFCRLRLRKRLLHQLDSEEKSMSLRELIDDDYKDVKIKKLIDEVRFLKSRHNFDMWFIDIMDLFLKNQGEQEYKLLMAKFGDWYDKMEKKIKLKG